MDRSITGGCLVFVGFFLFIAFMATPGKESLLFNFAMSVLLSGPPMLLGGWLLRNYFKSKAEAKKTAETAHEKEVLLLAGRKGGSLSVSQVVAETTLDAAQAETTLQQLVAHGCANVRASESGLQVVYDFYDFLSPGEKEPHKESAPSSAFPDRLKE